MNKQPHEILLMKKRAYYAENKEKLKESKRIYRINNKENLKEKHRIYNIENKEKRNLFYIKNKEKIDEEGRIYRIKNKEKINERIRIYHSQNKDKTSLYRNNRIKTDIQFKLTIRLRCRFYQAIKRGFKSGSAVRDLGCTIAELKIYLEKRFLEGMNWENWGLFGWHIDHIRPLCKFNLSNRNEFLEACHYSNLQPLWWNENLAKGSK